MGIVEDFMKMGKVPNDLLKEIIFGKIKNTQKDVILRPGIGEDCSAIDFGDYVCVLSSDPITGAKNQVGHLAVHISCNDIASCGVAPMGLLVTILAPKGTTIQDLNMVMDDIANTAYSLKVDILGGHTEITDAVNRFVVITTAVGKAPKGGIVATNGAKVGDDLILTKHAGIEGAAIIAHDREDELKYVLGNDIVEKAKKFIDEISVIKEGVIAGEFGASAMHDVTEGGVLGAVWEMAEASELGLVIYRDKIPVKPETQKICKHYNIDPLKLISSGSMLIACSNGEELIKKLAESNIKASAIGKFDESANRILISGETKINIDQPAIDELYKITNV